MGYLTGVSMMMIWLFIHYLLAVTDFDWARVGFSVESTVFLVGHKCAFRTRQTMRGCIILGGGAIILMTFRKAMDTWASR
jgi:hypothetical protein